MKLPCVRKSLQVNQHHLGFGSVLSGAKHEVSQVVREVLIQDSHSIDISYCHILPKHTENLLPPTQKKKKGRKKLNLLHSKLQAILYNSLFLRFLCKWTHGLSLWCYTVGCSPVPLSVLQLCATETAVTRSTLSSERHVAFRVLASALVQTPFSILPNQTQACWFQRWDLLLYVVMLTGSLSAGWRSSGQGRLSKKKIMCVYLGFPCQYLPQARG